MPPVQLMPSRDADLLLPLRRDAEEGDARVLQALEGTSTIAYLAVNGDKTVGAVVVRWTADESEIVYIATRAELRGQGYGKAIVAGVVDEATRRDVSALIVGTANSSMSNIAFYQKCGFRMDSVRKDFFDYFPSSIFEDGIQMRDMLALRMDISDTAT